MSVSMNPEGALLSFPMTRRMERRVFRAHYGVTGLRGLRLTRRGKATLIFLALIVSAVAIFAGSSAAARQPLEAIPVETYPVAAGDSLWSIASSLGTHGDVRDVVDDIVKLNHLPSASIQAGTVILLPVYNR